MDGTISIEALSRWRDKFGSPIQVLDLSGDFFFPKHPLNGPRDQQNHEHERKVRESFREGGRGFQLPPGCSAELVLQLVD
jgi:hypothetical protein